MMRNILRMMLKRRMWSKKKKRRMRMDRMEETLPEVLALKISLAGKLWVVVPVPCKWVNNSSYSCVSNSKSSFYSVGQQCLINSLLSATV